MKINGVDYIKLSEYNRLKKSKVKTKIVKEVQIQIEERIKEVEKIIDAECKVDPVAIKILNDAAAPVGEAK
jgi:hypoxanthine-guanine phosphoribosyltransferase